MAGIWKNTGEEWELASPQAYEDEATLHKLIEQNPGLLPLAGSPDLSVLGSEVYLGIGYADLLAVESSGRPAIIEVKLARSSEARRAIVSQIISYAAFLHGLTVERLEQGTLRKPLADAGYMSILDAVQSQDQKGAVDVGTFSASMQEYLDQGNFRLVLVLDEVPAELERLIAYLDAMTIQALAIDLITLKVYEVNGAQVALPQRISPDISAAMPAADDSRSLPKKHEGIVSDGSAAFRASLEGATDEARAKFEELIVWAEQLAKLPNVRLSSYTGVNRFTLLPRIMPDNAGLVTIWNDKQQPYISVWKSVFKRHAPNSIEIVEKVIEPSKIGQGNTIQKVSPQVIDAFTKAYEEASNR